MDGTTVDPAARLAAMGGLWASDRAETPPIEPLGPRATDHGHRVEARGTA